MALPVIRALIRRRPTVVAEAVAVALQLATYRLFVHSDLPSNGRRPLAFLYSQIYCISLLTGQVFVHSNTKIVDPFGRRNASLFVLLFDPANAVGLARRRCTSILNLRK